jgi:hypothetical protein
MLESKPPRNSRPQTHRNDGTGAKLETASLEGVKQIV